MYIMALWKWTDGNSISKIVIYFDYQLSKARRSFGEEVLDLKLRQYCDGQLSSFPISSPVIRSSTLLPMTSKADKLPLETEPVARDNNTS